MIDRRELILGIGCLAAAGGAAALRPRQRIDLVGNRTLATIIPERFADWSVDASVGSLIPPSEGSLADRLYNEILSRGYRQAGRPDQSSVMLLGTRGSDQSDALQLHRPETCYPAVGFSVADRRFLTLDLAPGIALPAVQLTAVLGERVEDIVYWTRIGRDFPRSAGEQRRDRLELALHGLVGDGVLMRLSAIRAPDGRPVFDTVIACAQAMAQSIKRPDRPALFATAGQG